MVEPVATLVLNSLLAARNSRVCAPSALKMLSTLPANTLLPNFFTPHPRKGKERAYDLPHVHLDCSRPWLSEMFENASFDTASHSPGSSCTPVLIPPKSNLNLNFQKRPPLVPLLHPPHTRARVAPWSAPGRYHPIAATPHRVTSG